MRLFRVHCVFDHRASLNKLKKSNLILQGLLFGQFAIKLQISNKNDDNSQILKKFNDILLNNQWLTEKITRDIRK